LNNILSNKLAFITGANRGIGKAIAHLFSAHGANLIIHSREKNSLNSLVKELNSKETKIYEVYFDLNDIDRINNSIKSIDKNFHSIDILVNNAGFQADGVIGMIPEKMINETYQTNVFGNIIISQWVSRLMMKKNKGSIINIGSIMGTQGARGQSVYASSKAAINGLTLSMAKELANYNIRVNCIAPGFIQTRMTEKLKKSQYINRIKQIRMNRIGSPEDVANLALFLASDSSNYITGQIIQVDGGMKI